MRAEDKRFVWALGYRSEDGEEGRICSEKMNVQSQVNLGAARTALFARPVRNPRSLVTCTESLPLKASDSYGSGKKSFK